MEYGLKDDLQRRSKGKSRRDYKFIILTSLQIPPGQYLTCVAYDHIDTKQYWDLDYPDKVGLHLPRDSLVQFLPSNRISRIACRLLIDVVECARD